MNDFDLDKLFNDKLGNGDADIKFRERVLTESMLTLRKSRRLHTQLRMIGMAAAVLVIAVGSFISGQMYSSRWSQFGAMSADNGGRTGFVEYSADLANNAQESFWQAKAMAASAMNVHSGSSTSISFSNLAKYKEAKGAL